MSASVLDCSVGMAWCFEDEADRYADGVLDRLVEETALVPPLWPLEIANVLVVAERRRRLPFGRLGKADDVVGPAVFLASDESEWVTGSVLYADGGYVTAAATDAEHRAVEVPYRGD